MNDENLKSLGDRPLEERRRIASEGGKASVKVRRDKRTFRKTLQTLLELTRTTEDGKPMLNKVTGKPMSMIEEAAMTAIFGAIDGDVKYLQTILDVLGERSLKIDNTISGDMSADIRITHIVSGYQPATSEAEVLQREGMEDDG